MTRFHAVLAVLIILAMLCLVMMAKAFAQQPCGPTADVLKMISEKYHEAAIGGGTAQDGKVVISTFANAETGTWTIVVSGADGKSCIIAAGADYAASPAPRKGTDS